MFRVILFCFLFSLISAQTNCRVSNIEIQTLQNGTGYNATTVRGFLTKYPIRFADPETDFMSCVDGRAFWPDYATPGGDAGEFLLGLSVFTRNGGNASSFERVRDLFNRFLLTLNSKRYFYMHTDTHALEHLSQELNETYNITNFDIFNVSTNIQETVLSIIAEPSNIGCGHVRYTSLHPDQYQLDSEVTNNFIRAFYDTYWNGVGKLHFRVLNITILHDDHAEKAVVSVTANSTASCRRFAPMLVPDTEPDDLQGGSVYLNHPQFTDTMRNLLATFFAAELGMNATLIRSQIEEIAAIALGYSLGYLAPGLPIYEAILTVTDSPITTGVAEASEVSASSNLFAPFLFIFFVLFM